MLSTLQAIHSRYGNDPEGGDDDEDLDGKTIAGFTTTTRTEYAVVEEESSKLDAPKCRGLEKLVRFQQLAKDGIRKVFARDSLTSYLAFIYRVLVESIRVAIRFGIGRSITPDTPFDTW